MTSIFDMIQDFWDKKLLIILPTFLVALVTSVMAINTPRIEKSELKFEFALYIPEPYNSRILVDFTKSLYSGDGLKEWSRNSNDDIASQNAFPNFVGHTFSIPHYFLNEMQILDNRIIVKSNDTKVLKQLRDYVLFILEGVEKNIFNDAHSRNKKLDESLRSAPSSSFELVGYYLELSSFTNRLQNGEKLYRVDENFLPIPTQSTFMSTLYFRVLLTISVTISGIFFWFCYRKVFTSK